MNWINVDSSWKVFLKSTLKEVIMNFKHEICSEIIILKLLHFSVKKILYIICRLRKSCVCLLTSLLLLCFALLFLPWTRKWKSLTPVTRGRAASVWKQTFGKIITRVTLNAKIPSAAWIGMPAKCWDSETVRTVKKSRKTIIKYMIMQRMETMKQSDQ